MDNEYYKGAIGCGIICMFALFSFVVSFAVGCFFGPGFGLIVFSAFVVFSIAVLINAFYKVGK